MPDLDDPIAAAADDPAQVLDTYAARLERLADPDRDRPVGLLSGTAEDYPRFAGEALTFAAQDLGPVDPDATDELTAAGARGAAAAREVAGTMTRRLAAVHDPGPEPSGDPDRLDDLAELVAIAITATRDLARIVVDVGIRTTALAGGDEDRARRHARRAQRTLEHLETAVDAAEDLTR